MLVKPLVPSQLSKLIQSGESDETGYGSANMLMDIIEDLLYDERADRRCDVHCCSIVLDAKLKAQVGSVRGQSALRTSLESKRFASLIVECLWFLRFHDGKSARQVFEQAKELLSRRECSIARVAALESLGVASALVTELEDKLARIEPCL